MSQTSCLNKCNMFWEMFCYFRLPDLLEVWSISDSTLFFAAHFSANSLTHQSYLEVSGSHQLHVWISQYSTNFSWISCRETEVFGAKTVLTPGRCHQGRKSHQRVRGWQGVHEFQEITLDIIIGTYRKAASHETTRVWILYVGVFLLPGSLQHLFLTRVVSTTYFLLKTRAHEIQ